VPTRETEKAVVRILSPEGALGLSELAVPSADLKRLRDLIAQRDGIVIVTGPTGSGKTTTLYSAIRELASSGQINVMTVEDPVEYELSGVTQIQVAPRRGVTFASSLRAILRQDPDVILVGEIRDLETAAIAVQASVTGHLVLATLHTNDAVGVIPRLSALGLHPSSVASSFRGAVAQRLIRKICSHCRETIDALTADEQRLADRFGVIPTVRAPGCDKCGQSGYRGRLPLIEVLVKRADMEDLIGNGASAQELTRSAVESGMVPMASMALERAKEGMTTLEEVARVLGKDHQPRPAPKSTGPHVLVVDHDIDSRARSRSLVEDSGYRVTEAETGVAALELIEREVDLSLVVAEVAMPGLDGHEFLSRIRGSVATVGLPVIVLTDAQDSSLETSLMEEGADDYLRKPYVPQAFIRRVKATLERSKIHEPVGGGIQTDLSRLLEETEPSIAVLPFADLSQQSDLAYLCEGLAEELINSLTRLEGLRVAARTSAFRFRDTGPGVRELGKTARRDGSSRRECSKVRGSTAYLGPTGEC
jgi:Tfp pilus assembly pilus retraction ATPase PilT/CheY-like chemotaxis protein